MSVECFICGYDIKKYFGSVIVRMCPDCQILYCKACGNRNLKKGKCRKCGKPTIKIKRPTRNPFELHMSLEEKLKKAEKNREIYRLKVISKGNKDARKVSVGVHMFSVGTEFGGGEHDERKLQCGNCKKRDYLRIIDEEQFLYQCSKCGALNKPDKAGRKILLNQRIRF